MQQDTLQDFSAEVVLEAIERNFFGFASAYVEQRQGMVHTDTECSWVLGGTSMVNFNSVFCTRVTGSVDTVILAVQEQFQARQQYMTWWVTPLARPHNLAERLLAHGYTWLFQDAGMAVDLQALREPAVLPPDVTIERVEDEGALDDWMNAYSHGFGVEAELARTYRQMIRSVLTGEHRVQPYYLARLAGRPVAVSALYCGAGVAGVYEVTTIPEARGRGIGSAITLAALLDARAMGYRIGVLQATGMGVPVYQRLGFRTYGPLDAYGWQPPTAI